MVVNELGLKVKNILEQDLRKKIELAEKIALQNALQQVYIFLLTDGRIPRDTGLMVRTAIQHVFSSAAAGAFDLDIWFDTFYAEWVNNNAFIGNSGVANYNKDFLERIKPSLEQIIAQAIVSGFSGQGFKNVTVVFP